MNLTHENSLSSCESDTAEDPSLRRSLRGAGRKGKVRSRSCCIMPLPAMLPLYS